MATAFASPASPSGRSCSVLAEGLGLGTPAMAKRTSACWSTTPGQTTPSNGSSGSGAWSATIGCAKKESRAAGFSHAASCPCPSSAPFITAIAGESAACRKVLMGGCCRRLDSFMGRTKKEVRSSQGTVGLRENGYVTATPKQTKVRLCPLCRGCRSRRIVSPAHAGNGSWFMGFSQPKRVTTETVG